MLEHYNSEPTVHAMSFAVNVVYTVDRLSKTGDVDQHSSKWEYKVLQVNKLTVDSTKSINARKQGFVCIRRELYKGECISHDMELGTVVYSSKQTANIQVISITNTIPA